MGDMNTVQQSSSAAVPALILQGLDAAVCARLRQRASQKTYHKGQTIIRVHDEDSQFYLIDAGWVRATLYSADGKEVIFADIGAGGHFGELAAIDGQPRSANVVALTDCTLTLIRATEFQALLQYPAVSIALLQQLTAMARRLCDRVFEYSTMDVDNRLYLELIRLLQDNLDLDGIARINNPPTQMELANRISCTRETVSRIFSKLEQAGIIKRAHKRLIIEDVPGLYQRAGQPSGDGE